MTINSGVFCFMAKITPTIVIRSPIVTESIPKYSNEIKKKLSAEVHSRTTLRKKNRRIIKLSAIVINGVSIRTFTAFRPERAI